MGQVCGGGRQRVYRMIIREMKTSNQLNSEARHYLLIGDACRVNQMVPCEHVLEALMTGARKATCGEHN